MLGLIATLTDDVTVFSDGGKAFAARKPVVGRDKVALFLTNILRLAPEDTRLQIEQINGQPGIVTIPLGFATLIAVSLLTRPRSAA